MRGTWTPPSTPVELTAALWLAKHFDSTWNRTTYKFVVFQWSKTRAVWPLHKDTPAEDIPKIMSALESVGAEWLCDQYSQQWREHYGAPALVRWDSFALGEHFMHEDCSPNERQIKYAIEKVDADATCRV